jgi:hypothetical protein
VERRLGGGGRGGGAQLEEELVEVGDGAGDAERALLADTDRDVDLRHARAAVQGRLRGHAGEPTEQALHAAFE